MPAPARSVMHLAPSPRAVLCVALGLASLRVSTADGPQRLHIKNSCRAPIWIAHEAATGIGVDVQNVKIESGSVFHFQTPSGLSATRYWPKLGCDEHGGMCGLGNSGGPGESCVRRGAFDDYSHCAPPIDTKFEATFDSAGFDFVDMSLVDGWTLPFTLKISGGECIGQKGSSSETFMDCSGLTLQACPANEKLTAAGLTVDLRATNPETKEMVGCYAPCQKLIDGKFNNTAAWSGARARAAEDPEVAPYCCPTPPESPAACRAGPIEHTSFIDAVHTKCPGVYGYAYDDGMGLLKCATTTTYELTFMCPDLKDSMLERHSKKPAVTQPVTQPLPEAPALVTTKAPSPTEDEKKKWVVRDPDDALFGQTVPESAVEDKSFVKDGHKGFVEWKNAFHFVRQPQQKTEEVLEWVVSDAEDDLFGRVVPDELTKDPKRFFADKDHGFVKWMHASHEIKLRQRSVAVLDKASTWVVTDPEDDLFGHVVPDDLIKDPNRFMRDGDHGFVEWQHATHVVQQRSEEEHSAQTQDGSPLVWVVSDQNDKLFGQVVPNDIIEDSKRFVQNGDRGFVEWKHATHLVRRRKSGEIGCGGDGESPCEVSITDMHPSWADMLSGKSEESRPLNVLAASWRSVPAPWLAGAMVLASLALSGFACRRVAGSALPPRHDIEGVSSLEHGWSAVRCLVHSQEGEDAIDEAL